LDSSIVVGWNEKSKTSSENLLFAAALMALTALTLMLIYGEANEG